MSCTLWGKGERHSFTKKIRTYQAISVWGKFRAHFKFGWLFVETVTLWSAVLKATERKSCVTQGPGRYNQFSPRATVASKYYWEVPELHQAMQKFLMLFHTLRCVGRGVWWGSQTFLQLCGKTQSTRGYECCQINYICKHRKAGRRGRAGFPCGICSSVLLL